MADTAELASQLQRLPAEIFNHIYALTIAVDNDVLIDRTYKPPIGLQLSRNIREAFACDYYANTTFHLDFSRSSTTLKHWLAVLPVDHVKHMRTLRIDVYRNATMSFLDRIRLQKTGFSLNLWKRQVSSRSGVTNADFLRVKNWKQDGETWKMVD